MLKNEKADNLIIGFLFISDERFTTLRLVNRFQCSSKMLLYQN